MKEIVVKGERSIKILFGKARRAAEEARDAELSRRGVANEEGWDSAAFEELRALEAKTREAEEYAQAIWDAADKAGVYILSYKYSRVNPTRDLVFANMD